MRVFVTGGTGFVGRGLVPELLAAGHEVVGLARSDASAAALKVAGAEVRRGGLDDLDALRKAAASSDGVIHTAFAHGSPDAGATDLRCVQALGEALTGSGRPLVITSAVSLSSPGQRTTEADPIGPTTPGAARIPSEEAATALAAQGVRTSVVRLAIVHDTGDEKGFLRTLIAIAAAKGASAMVGDGSNLWPAVHRSDAVRLFRLALEDAPAGSTVHGVAEEGVPFRDIADVIGRRLGLPTVSLSPADAPTHFGHLADFAAAGGPTSSERTRHTTGWTPQGPTLIPDFTANYFPA